MTRREKEQINKLLAQVQALKKLSRQMQHTYNIGIDEYQRKIKDLNEQLQYKRKLSNEKVKEAIAPLKKEIEYLKKELREARLAR